jgi:uncharacterized membrane protein HdeD (DUF308 family)
MVKLIYTSAIMSMVFAFTKRYEAHQDWLLIGGFVGLVLGLVAQMLSEREGQIALVGLLIMNFTKVVIFLIAAGLAAWQVFFVWH